MIVNDITRKYFFFIYQFYLKKKTKLVIKIRKLTI